MKKNIVKISTILLFSIGTIFFLPSNAITSVNPTNCKCYWADKAYDFWEYKCYRGAKYECLCVNRCPEWGWVGPCD